MTSAVMNLVNSGSAAAVDPARFNASRIIDDGVFYNKDTMSIQQIQAFLDSNVPPCDTWGTQPSGYGGTRAQYAASVGWPGPPYVCLQNYQENPSNGETSFEKGGGQFQGGISSAHIIYNAAQQYGINPQVLLVLLKKEQGSLFYDDWPLKSQYKYAMGYACPDSGPNNSANCDSTQGGFYKQVMLAAYQLRRYANHISEYNYQPGRSNYIQYSPNTACGGSNVHIENLATASLYIYTPYQPTQAALNAYPGTTNCGAYGNRNFWFYFQEWFGTTLQSDIVRTYDNGDLYLLANEKKYHITSMEVLARLQTISPTISYVSQQYLDTYTTGPLVKTALRNPETGAIYLIDSGYKLQFNTCDMVADYGLDCSSIPDATSIQLARYKTGPRVTNFFTRSEDEKRYYINEGKRSEIFDTQSMQLAGLNGSFNRLSFSAIDNLSVNTPIVRDNILLRNPTSGAIYFYDSQGVSYLDGAIYNLTMFKTLPLAQMTGTSIGKLPSSSAMTGVVQSSGGQKYLLGPDSKIATNMSGNYRVISDSVLAKHTTVTTKLIQKQNASEVYYFASDTGTLHHIVRWSDVLYVDRSARIETVVDSALKKLITSEIIYYRPLTLIKSTDDPRVYMIDQDLATKKLVNSFSHTAALGVGSSVVSVGNLTLGGYTTQGVVNELVNCGGDLYIASSGRLYYVNGSKLLQYGLNGIDFEVMSSDACQGLSMASAQIGDFAIASNSAIYQLISGKKHYITSMSVYTARGGNTSNTLRIGNTVLNRIPDGDNL